MRGSTLIPWLLIGPILLSMAGYITFLLTGWKAAAVVALAGMSIAVLVMVCAFIANFGLSRRREREQDQDRSDTRE